MRKNPYAHMTPVTVVVLWAAKLVACAFLGYHGYHKLAGNPGEMALFQALGMEPAGRFIIGGLEILAVILLLIPQSAAYGALLGVAVMLGAVIAHLTIIGTGFLPYALLVLFCCLTVLYIRRADAEFLHNLVDR